jgi:hypothetical protein
VTKSVGPKVSMCVQGAHVTGDISRICSAREIARLTVEFQAGAAIVSVEASQGVAVPHLSAAIPHRD